MLFSKTLSAKNVDKANGKLVLKRWSKMSIGTKISVIFILALIVCAVFAPLIAAHDPSEISLYYRTP